MKTSFSYVLVTSIVIFLTNCTKDTLVKPPTNIEASDPASIDLAAQGSVNSVHTIAGHRYNTGETLIDGPAAIARFNYPYGIQLKDDGRIFVADSGNNVIRLISPAGEVSTFNIPDRSPFSNPYLHLRSPKYVAVDEYGVVYVIDHDYYSTKHDEMRIYSPITATQLAGYGNIYYDAKDIVIDPYYPNFVWTIIGSSIRKIMARKSDGYYTIYPLTFTIKVLPDNPRNYTFPALFPGYNGVIYFAYKGKLYKHSKDDTGGKIFPNLTFKNITCIRANKDSRTLYIADDGYIKRIDDGKLTTIAGPNNTYADSRDGIGFNADIYAKYLALSKDESTLYFSDTKANAIRKINLR